jgi:hypothetical protein
LAQAINISAAGTLAILALASAILPISRSAEHLNRVSRDRLCVTEGSVSEVGRHFEVSVPKMRAYLMRWTSQAIAADFTYQGPSASEAALASGETRRQFGLKLRAQDACNLVYAMWRFAPQAELVVSVKSNPGQHASAECGNRGYRNVKPSRGSRVPVLRQGDRHSLRAEMNGEQLLVSVDGAVVWDGNVGSDALRLDGPVGIRSDNVRLEIELQAGEVLSARPNPVIACRSGPAEDE